jgi:hypothetical protein
MDGNQSVFNTRQPDNQSGEILISYGRITDFYMANAVLSTAEVEKAMGNGLLAAA